MTVSTSPSQKGEIHALLGENGAGKSTLVKILFGSLQQTAGDVLWNGDIVHVNSPSQARALGHRHGVPALFPV